MKKLLGVLGFTAFTYQSTNIFGGGENHVRLTKEQLEKIDAALPDEGATNTATENTKTIANLQSKVDAFTAGETSIQEALTTAYQENGFKAVEGQSTLEAIAHLSAKCKEFGSSNNTHSIPPTDGKDKNDDNDLIEGYIDPNAEHNKIINKVFNR